MKWETMGGMPTPGLLDKQILEKLRELEELLAMRGHVVADSDEVQSHGWLGCSQLVKKMQDAVIKLATKGTLN